MHFKRCTQLPTPPNTRSSLSSSTGPDDGQDSILFIWPLNVVHTIDDRSPLYQMSAEDLLHKERFEIVVMLEGSTESTAMTTQARSSYIPSEILWGHRYVVHERPARFYGNAGTQHRDAQRDSLGRRARRTWVPSYILWEYGHIA